MSRIYKQVHTHTGQSVAPGDFAKYKLYLNSGIIHGDTVIISWNGVSRTYEFVDDGTGVDHVRASTSRPSTKVALDNDLRILTFNLVATIRTNVDHIAAGRDDTILPVVDQDTGGWFIGVYSQAKHTGSINITGTGVNTLLSKSSNLGVSPTGTYSTDKGYVGIFVAGTYGAEVSVDLLMRCEDTSGVPGAPENNLETVNVKLRAGILYDIETYGCSTNCTVFG